MAKAPAVTKQQATALATTSFSEDLAALKSRLSAPTGDKIKIDNKQFKLPDGSVAPALDVVIVDFVYYNTYYETGYQKGVVSAPVCAALSVEPKGMAPLNGCSDLQSAGCDGCAQNQFGSKGAGKACQNRVLIAILPADATESTPMAILDLPPTSIVPFQKYVASVAGALQRPPYGVITHVECDQNETYAKIIFSDPQLFDLESDEDVAAVNLIRSRRQEARERLLTPPDLTAANDAAPAKKPALKTPARRRA
jgi:hypothetical protein